MKVSAVIVVYGPEPWLDQAVEHCLASESVDVEVVVVDNGGTEGAVDRLDGREGVTLLRPGRNLGFAEGCNAAVAASTGDVVALVNPDALVEPSALAHLARVAQIDGVGIATASVRLADRPDVLNSAGNEIHPSGVSWSGSFEVPASARAAPREVMAASGAACALRRTVWDDLDGFNEQFFAYCEDAELSLRCWQRAMKVLYVPEAVVRHRYEFARRPSKFELLERNRLLMVSTCYETRTLMVLAPMLLFVELGLIAMALQQGWLRQKLAGWRWLVTHRREVARRRRTVQAARRVPDRAYAHLFAEDLLPGNLPPPQWFRPINAALKGYWKLARRLL